MKNHLALTLCISLLALGCASEDPNIIDPPPGSARILLRFINAVPDDQQRKMLLDLGFQTPFVLPGGIGDTIRAPSDSSFIEVIGATSEFRTPSRYRFAQQSIYDVVGLGAANSAANGFDTIMVMNANVSLTTLPVAQIRVVNAFPDTNVTYDVRIGCPNGEPLSTGFVAFRQSSLYKEVPPGQAVFTIIKVSQTSSTILGTYECTLAERTPYSILIHPLNRLTEPQVLLYSESDFSNTPERPFIAVSERDASIRVCNVSSSSVTVKLATTDQTLTTNQTTSTMNSYVSVPTCEYTRADVFDATYSDGRTATDSTALTVKGRYTIVAADTGSDARLIIVPPPPVVYGAAGKAIIRVVHACAVSGSVAMSIGARTDPMSPTNIASGVPLTQNISFDTVSSPVVVEAGELPLTITTANPPTSIKQIGRATVLADHAYLFVVTNLPDGQLVTYLVDENDDAGTLQPISSGVLMSVVNGSPSTENVIVSLGSVVVNGTLHYRNSFVTSVWEGATPVSIAGLSQSVNAVLNIRTLLVYTIKGQSEEKLIEISAPPLRQISGQSDRRVINATADVSFVSVSYDTNFRSGGTTENVAQDVAFGTASATYVLERDRRGTMYFYDAETRKDLFTLPIDFGPLGNSYSLIVAGRHEDGYEVIVLQEF